MIILQLVFAFLLPPVAVALKEGLSTHFWISVALTILGWIPGIIHALWVTLMKPAGAA